MATSVMLGSFSISEDRQLQISPRDVTRVRPPVHRVRPWDIGFLNQIVLQPLRDGAAARLVADEQLAPGNKLSRLQKVFRLIKRYLSEFLRESRVFLPKSDEHGNLRVLLHDPFPREVPVVVAWCPVDDDFDARVFRWSLPLRLQFQPGVS